MRPIAAANALLMALLLVAAPLAAAEGEKGREKSEDAKLHRDARADHHRDNKTDDGNKTAKAEKARTHADAFRAAMTKWREAWKENATAIREGCRAVVLDHDNATKEEKRAWAHCIRDGYHQFFQALKLERKAWKAQQRGD